MPCSEAARASRTIGVGLDMLLALPKVPIRFSSTAPRSVRTQVLVRAACVETVRRLELILRVHEVTIGGAATLAIVALAVAPTREQPEVDYVGDDILTSLPLAGTAVGTLLRGEILPPLPTHVQLQARVTQPNPAQTIVATVSIELTGKR